MGETRRKIGRGLQRFGEVIASSGLSEVFEQKTSSERSPNNRLDQEAATVHLNRVKTLVEICHERFSDGVEVDWALDYNLPELHAATEAFYDVSGETDRLLEAGQRYKQHSPTNTSETA